jgi:hypothetical protein
MFSILDWSFSIQTGRPLYFRLVINDNAITHSISTFLDINAGYQNENHYNPVTHNHVEKQIIINYPGYRKFQGTLRNLYIQYSFKKLAE